MKNKLVYIKSPSIFLSRGFSRSIVYNFQSNKYLFVDNEVANFIEELGLNYIQCEEADIAFFLNHQILIKIPQKLAKNIQSISLEENPSYKKIEYIIFIVSKESILNLSKIIDTDCRDILIDLTKLDIEKFQIELINNILSNSAITSIQVNILSSQLKFIEQFSNQIKLRINLLLIVQNDKTVIPDKIEGILNYKISSTHIYENNNRVYQVFDLRSVLVSRKKNLYYNKVLIIDENNRIRLSFFDNLIIGNIDSDDILEKVQEFENNDLWNTNKDSVLVCKNCEYRFFCMDKTLLIKNVNNEWIRPIECNYNPYICKWDNEEGYKSLKECGVICTKEEFKIDTEILDKINEVLWE